VTDQLWPQSNQNEDAKRILLISGRHEDGLEFSERKEKGDEDEEEAKNGTKTNEIQGLRRMTV
jgi:hypothetical protein